MIHFNGNKGVYPFYSGGLLMTQLYSSIITQCFTYIIVANNFVVEVDHSFENLTGFAKEEVCNKSVFTVINKILKIRADVDTLELNQDKKSYYLFTKDNEVREVDIYVADSDDSNVKVYRFIERQNSQLEDKLIFINHQFTENINCISIFSVPDLILLKANERCVDHFNAPYNKLDNSIGRSVYEILSEQVAGRVEQLQRELIRTQKPVYLKEYPLQESDKKITYWSTTITPVFDKGELKYMFIYSIDETELIANNKLITDQRENLLKSQIEKNKLLEDLVVMKDEFLATISHEFKIPLNVINSSIQALDMFCKDELSARAKKYIKFIKQNTFRQLRLVNNILDISRIQAGKININKKNLNIVFISESIVESVRVYAQQKDIQINFKSELKQKIISIDEAKFERILLNLLSNAIKFTPEGKEITVDVSQKTGYVQIKVEDMGIGIPADKQKVIFDRFGQVDSSLSRQAEGTGIGLSLVKVLVNAMNGKIYVKSTLGKGSSFVVLLPDKKAKERIAESTLIELTDNRLIHAIEIEFSDIYLN